MSLAKSCYALQLQRATFQQFFWISQHGSLGLVEKREDILTQPELEQHLNIVSGLHYGSTSHLSAPSHTSTIQGYSNDLDGNKADGHSNCVCFLSLKMCSWIVRCGHQANGNECEIKTFCFAVHPDNYRRAHLHPSTWPAVTNSGSGSVAESKQIVGQNSETCQVSNPIYDIILNSLFVHLHVASHVDGAADVAIQQETNIVHVICTQECI